MSNDLQNQVQNEAFRNQIEEELKNLETKENKSDVQDNSNKEERQSSSQPEFSEVEMEQMHKGWLPKETFMERGGKEEDWVPAKQFKRIGEIIDAKRTAGKKADREIDELTKTVKQLIDDQRLTKQRALEQARQELSVKKMEKIREGDVDAVLNIEKQLEGVKLEEATVTTNKTAPEQTQSKDYDTPEIAAFKEKHKDWMQGTSQEDKKMQAFLAAQAMAYETLQKHNPDMTDSVCLQEIEELLVKKFPDKFPETAPKSKVSKFGTSTSSGASKNSVSTADLNYEQRHEFAAINKVDPTYTVEEYVKQLKLVGRLN